MGRPSSKSGLDDEWEYTEEEGAAIQHTAESKKHPIIKYSSILI